MTDLSPAAQAVLDAYGNQIGGTDAIMGSERRGVVAALRAAADLLHQEVEPPKVDGSKYAGLWHSYDYLIAIAAELEGSND